VTEKHTRFQKKNRGHPLKCPATQNAGKVVDDDKPTDGLSNEMNEEELEFQVAMPVSLYVGISTKPELKADSLTQLVEVKELIIGDRQNPGKPVQVDTILNQKEYRLRGEKTIKFFLYLWYWSKEQYPELLKRCCFVTIHNSVAANRIDAALQLQHLGTGCTLRIFRDAGKHASHIL
jgi:hypothetical protein